ncbi:MAG: GAF domain-containing protein [Reinekea sp.]
MNEPLIVSSGVSRLQQYQELLSQLRGLTSGEPDLTANLANVAAALRQSFNFFWVGFYLVQGDELVLGPFQGDIACTRIARGRGVCGTAWENAQTQVVADVDAFPGHIACSSQSRSEVVVPLIRQGTVIAVLDVDSDRRDGFSDDDVQGLNSLCEWLIELF